MRYQHTQIGWAIIAGLLATSGLLAAIFASLPDELAGPMRWVPLLLVLPLLLFASLTVSLDDRELRLRFGIGVIGKKVPLGQIRSFSVVRNSWLYGWGIHGFPGGVLYNVSGMRAVELVLVNGNRVRVGTDEPEELARTLEAAIGKPAPLTEAEQQQLARKRRRWLLVALPLLLALFVVVGGSIGLMARPIDATVRDGRLVVSSFIYGDEWDLSRIRSVELVSTLPASGVRTNGMALGSTLRGWFRLQGLGEGQVFLQADRPPFIRLLLEGGGFVLLNFEEPARTRQLYDALAAAARARPSAPPERG